MHEGRKHYFLVEFPQEPGALRRFLDEVLGPDDDITLFEYVKRNNRETGPALVGIELARRDDLAALLARMEAAPMRIEQIDPGTPAFAYLSCTRHDLSCARPAGPGTDDGPMTLTDRLPARARPRRPVRGVRRAGRGPRARRSTRPRRRR